MALFHFVQSNPQGRSSGRASVSPALVRVARCAFVRRDTRVRKVQMMRCVRRAFPGRCRGARARVLRSNRRRLTRRAPFFWRRGAMCDRRFVGSRFRDSPVERECTRSPAFRGREIKDCKRTSIRRETVEKDAILDPTKRARKKVVFEKSREGEPSRLRAFPSLVSCPVMSRPPPRAATDAHHAPWPRRRLDVSLLRSDFDGKSEKRDDARRGEAAVHPTFILHNSSVRVAAPAAAPARAFPLYPRARQRLGPSSCPPQGHPRASARR